MNDLLTGFLLTILTGVLWSFTGVYYKSMAKWNLSLYNIMMFMGGLSFLMTLLIFTKTEDLLSGKLPLPSAGYTLFIFAASLTNIAGSFILQRSMIYGKSGVTWAVGQSAFILPFIAVTLIFSEPWNILKGLGTLSVLAGMIFFSVKTSPEAKTEALQTKKGIKLAFLAFFVLGTAQSMTSASSFFAYEDPAMLRPAIACFSTFLAACAGKFFTGERGLHLNRKALLLIFFLSLQTVIATAIQFLALDKLKKYGMNGTFFPVAIGLCIAGYSLWSIVLFKEKAGRYFICGLFLILAGLFCYLLADAKILQF
ncbi:MAG: hypothetical protein J6S53_07705 [Lentisphaeria bacterium]|nr:hypothetical protein [Lentisphaeria bacterium]